MLRDRTELQAILENILGSENVYFQPPESIKINYPAIVYNRARISNDFANNDVYKANQRYDITYITKDSDSEILEKLNRLPYCRNDRNFISDNLYHYVFEIMY